MGVFWMAVLGRFIEEHPFESLDVYIKYKTFLG
jgi:hypothetical protein